MVRKKNKTRRSRSRRRRPRIFIFLFLFVLAIIAGFYVASLPIWEIKEVVINGTKILAAEEIRTLASIPISDNLFFASFSRAKSNLNKITAIKSFKFYRIPPATVLISIIEREPIATVVFPKRSIIIDKEGYIINRNPNLTLNITDMADLPVVSGIDEKKIVKADQIDESISEVITEIIFKLSPYLESKSMQLELGGLENVSFLLDDLLRVKVGEAEEIKRKMEVFKALLPVIAGNWSKVEYVDVRFPDNPVIKYR